MRESGARYDANTHLNRSGNSYVRCICKLVEERFTYQSCFQKAVGYHCNGSSDEMIAGLF